MTSRLIPACLLGLLVAGCATDGPRDPDAASRMRVAAAAEGQGQMDVALSMYAAAAARDPDNAQAQARLAAALVRSGNHAQAEQVLAIAVERLPNNRALMLQLGRVRLRGGQAGQALSLFDRVLLADSRNTDALDGRGGAIELNAIPPRTRKARISGG